MTLLMFHDDDCGELLTSEGLCPKCGFHPDGQSTSFKEVSAEEVQKLKASGRSLLGQYREPL